MEFEKQLDRIKNGQVNLVYLVQGKEPYLQELARKVFLETIVAPEDQDLNVGRFNMEEVIKFVLHLIRVIGSQR